MVFSGCILVSLYPWQVYQRKTMDLHGLHVSEAVEVLDLNMAALAKRGLDNVRLLTGTGHHSKGPTSKVRTKEGG